MKSSLFSTLAELAQAAPYFSFAAVKAALGNAPLVAKPELLREYLSEAMDKQVIHDAGRGWYSSLGEPAVFDPESTGQLRKALAGRFPFLPHYVWSTQQVNPWMHHLLGKFTHLGQATTDRPPFTGYEH